MNGSGNNSFCDIKVSLVFNEQFLVFIDDIKETAL